jgi:hypothetical protein
MTTARRHPGRIAFRAAVGLALLVAGVIGLVSGTTGSARAQGSAGGAIAAADGTDVSVVAVQGPLSDRPVDLALPSAQAGVDAQGTSAGYAAVPYPGDIVLNGPGLVKGATGAPVPPYPLYLESSYPTTPDASASEGPASMHSTSKETSTNATAASGIGSGNGSAGRSTATSTADAHNPQAVKAVADSITESVTIEGVLRIGTVHSHAQAERSTTGGTKKQADLSVDGLAIAGQAVSFTSRGLEVAGRPIAQVPQDPLAQILAQQGISVQYVAASQTDDGITAPILEVSFPFPVPGLPSPAVATYRFGLATATAGTVNLAGLGAGSSSDVGAASSTGPDSGAGAGGLTPSGPAGVGLPATDTAGGPLAAVAAPRPGTTGSASAGTRPLQQARVRNLGAASGLLPTNLGVGFYLALILSGLMTLGGASIFRFLGVRVAWRS